MKLPPKIAQLPIIWELRKLALYKLSAIKTVLKYKRFAVFRDSFVYFPIWWKFQKRTNEPLKNDRPWITFSAEKFLRRILRKDMTVFEYGAGSSTLYFSRRVAQVFSIEHDREWFDYLQHEFEKQEITNVVCRLIEPEALDGKNENTYFSDSPPYKGKSFEAYVKSIDAFPNKHFDIVVVDGRARASCIAHAKNKVKSGGYLMVDNADREAYFKGNDFLFDENEWKAYDFVGAVPYQFDFAKTVFFERLAE